MEGAMTSVRKGGRGMQLVKYGNKGVAFFATFRVSGVLIALMVGQKGYLISLIVRMDVGVKQMGIAAASKPDRPNYYNLGFSRSPPTFEI